MTSEILKGHSTSCVESRPFQPVSAFGARELLASNHMMPLIAEVARRT